MCLCPGANSMLPNAGITTEARRCIETRPSAVNVSCSSAEFAQLNDTATRWRSVGWSLSMVPYATLMVLFPTGMAMYQLENRNPWISCCGRWQATMTSSASVAAALASFNDLGFSCLILGLGIDHPRGRVKKKWRSHLRVKLFCLRVETNIWLY